MAEKIKRTPLKSVLVGGRVYPTEPIVEPLEKYGGREKQAWEYYGLHVPEGGEPTTGRLTGLPLPERGVEVSMPTGEKFHLSKEGYISSPNGWSKDLPLARLDLESGTVEPTNIGRVIPAVMQTLESIGNAISKTFATLGMPVSQLSGRVKGTNLPQYVHETTWGKGEPPTLEEVKAESRRPYEEYEQLPWWEQLLYETPGLIAAGGLTATGIKGALRGGSALTKGVRAVTAPVIEPVALAERVAGKVIGGATELGAAGLKKVLPRTAVESLEKTITKAIQGKTISEKELASLEKKFPEFGAQINRLRELVAPSTGLVRKQQIKSLTNLLNTTREQGARILLSAAPKEPTLIVAKLTQLIKSAKPAREVTEQLKHQELKKRVAAGAEVLEKVEGREAFYAAKAQQRGALPKGAFEAPEVGLKPEEVVQLFNQIRSDADLRFFTKINTADALEKILAGEIPTRGEIGLLEDTFGSDLAKTILSKRSLGRKTWENFLDVINLPRAVLASWDLSAPLRQGAVLAPSFPGSAKRAFVSQIRALMKEDTALMIDGSLRVGGAATRREAAGLYLSPLTRKASIIGSTREESFMSRFAEKIPGVRHSERAYITYLNKLRADAFDSTISRWEQMGFKLTMRDETQLATFINWATGRGDIGKLGGLGQALNSIFFAPRLQMSRLQTMFGGYRFTSPYVRSLYARTMATFIAANSTIVGLAGAAGAELEFDSRSADFGKIKIGNTRIDPWGGYLPYIRLISQMVTGETKSARGRVGEINRGEYFVRFVRSKLSPPAGLLADLIKGETFIGESMSLESTGLGEQAYQRLMPLFVQDLADALAQDGMLGGFAAAPGFLGWGIVTYPASIDRLNRHISEVPEDMLLSWQQGVKQTGKGLTYDDLNIAQQQWLREYADKVEPVEERVVAGEYSFWEADQESREDLREEFNTELIELLPHLKDGSMSVGDYVTEYERLRNAYMGTSLYKYKDKMFSRLDPMLQRNLDKWSGENMKPEDAAYNEFLEIRADIPKGKDGAIDWDIWQENINKFLMSQPPEIRDYIELRRISYINLLPPEIQPIEQLIIDCESVFDGYYAQPEGKARSSYRENNPEVDARLIIRNGLIPRSASALFIATNLLQNAGLPPLKVSYNPAPEETTSGLRRRTIK